jgi:1,4-alpha-glucan branching enzyme
LTLGAFCLVLHGHLPWVLGHGRWPHGEAWLYEAAAGCWLPMLDTLDRLAADGVPAGWAVGLTPVLLEQLAHERFRAGFSDWLTAAEARAKADQKRFRRAGEADRAALAGWWADRYRGQRKRMRRSIVREWTRHARSGSIELLTSNATHAYHPLIRHEPVARAQIRIGVATSKRHGVRAKGAWLPECAYKPGVAGLFADEGVRFWVVDAPALGRATPLEPYRVVEGGRKTKLTALARCPEVAEQVWSAERGYPGDPRYLEFHKREGRDGLRYWRVTGKVDLGEKRVYDPEEAAAAVRDQADHFVRVVRGKLFEHRAHTGRYGVLVAPFDLELFGHWWHEGPLFLEAIARRLQGHPEIDALRARDALDKVPAAPITLTEGSWGAGHDHRTWAHDGLKWASMLVTHAEDRWMDVWGRAPWRTDAVVRGWLEDAARQLLLLQASDWPFAYTTGGALDYAARRVGDHAARFDDLCNAVDDLSAGREPDPAAVAARAACRARDDVFRDLDLEAWA